MSRNDVVELFGVIKALYQNQFHGEAGAVTVWHRLLADLPRDHVFAALHQFASEGGDYPPNCPQILKRSRQRMEPATPTKVLAARSWCQILSNRGATSDPIGAEALGLMGGWSRLGRRPADQVELWGRRDFTELYLDLAARNSDRQLISLSDSGMVSALNGSNGDNSKDRTIDRTVRHCGKIDLMKQSDRKPSDEH